MSAGTRLEQVPINLLTNAIRFTPAGGQVGVTAGREGAQAIIAVRDTGALTDRPER